MLRLRLPPRIKVLEALGAIADKRINIIDSYRAKVVSSDGSRIYTVIVDLAKGFVYSDDNGTKYRGYVGYPIIAFLMLQGVLPFDRKISEALRGIQWRKLNEKYKKYIIVEAIVKDIAKNNGVDPHTIDLFVNSVMNHLRKMSLVYEEKLKALYDQSN